MNRWKASALHLLLSLLVIGGIALAVLLLWYPHGLYRISGLDHLLVVMLAIDITAGPLLTLVVYRAGKPSLRMDLAIIALCQAAFLAYGLFALWQSRPVFLVADEHRFNLVFANEIDRAELAAAAQPQWRRLSWTGPTLVGVRPPENLAARDDLLFDFLATGVDLDKRPRHYIPHAEVAAALVAGADPAPAPAAGQVPVLSRHGHVDLRIDARGRPLRVVKK